MNRRQFVITALSAPLAAPFATTLPVRAAERIFIGDMHAHLFFVGPRPAKSNPLGRAMAAGNATLVSWALVGDQPWLRLSGDGVKQQGTPKPGEGAKWLREELVRVNAHIAEQGLKIVKTAADVDRALAGEPHVVLSVEGATFAGDGPAEVAAAYEAGIRHLQLVHYIRNGLGDFQTEKPEHGGLTDLGRKIVDECNRAGILVDLAHCTSAAVNQALAVSRAPMVWSHSSVTRSAPAASSWTLPISKSRQLSLEDAKAIAGRGGVVGLWALPSDVGKTSEGYAARVAELAEWLGDDHAGFGTDMNAVSSPAVRNYADLARVVTLLDKRGLSPDRVRKIAIGNYARVLKAAFSARQA